jgi:hypothetical protein
MDMLIVTFHNVGNVPKKEWPMDKPAWNRTPDVGLK